MSTFARLALLTSLLVLPACGGDETTAAEATTPDGPIAATPGAKADGVSDDVPTLVFGADFSETLTAPVVAGQTLRVRYAPDRLPDCRGTQGGRPQWNITGYAAADGGEPVTFEVTQVEGDDRVAADALIEVPRGDDLALWFSVTNRWGCIAWDSNYGENYHVAVSTPAAEAVLDFAADGTVKAQGDLVAGGTLRVRYDLGRLSQCRGTQGGLPQWNITGHLAVDDAPEQTFEVSRVEGDDRVAEEAVLEVPRGRSLSLWFTSGDRWGCHETDDAEGAGHVFEIATAQGD